MRSQSPSTSSDMPHLNAAFDPDMDQYLDLDQNAVISSSTSPDTRSDSSATQSSSSSSFGNSQSQQQTFSGPSFQYESYKQQTGLPVGGLANTFALNQATGMQYNGYGNGFVMPVETLNVPLTTLDEFDFASYPLMDVDVEAGSPTDGMFHHAGSSSKGGYLNPNVLISHDNIPSTSAPVQRMFPGMHSQLAAQAKAQQAQKQNLTSQQSRQLPQGQRPLSQGSKVPAAKDPHVEESISRLLNQMRQSSVASVDDDCSTPTGNLPNLARMKRDEDDMDEDERLLASEEGKKLSSKERRQLRNKVSARAFRSRRKEYIGQLEGEVAMKAQEANDLKVQNRQLMEENTRLTDLTRMLLSSQAFSGFLSELSGTAPSSTSLGQQSQSDSPSQAAPKDVNPHKAARQLQSQQEQFGNVTMPDSALDFSLAENNASASRWNASLNSNNFSVYSVLEVPEGPALDEKTLSGKAGKNYPLQSYQIPVDQATKIDMPIIDYAEPLLEKKQWPSTLCSANPVSTLDLDRTPFSLYAEPPTTLGKSFTDLPSPSHRVADTKYVNPDAELGSGDSDEEALAECRLQLTCSRLDAISTRIAAVTSHLA